MDQQVRMAESLVDSANVGQCGGATIAFCSTNPCLNNGQCSEDPGSPHGYSCSCQEGYRCAFWNCVSASFVGDTSSCLFAVLSNMRKVVVFLSLAGIVMSYYTDRFSYTVDMINKVL